MRPINISTIAITMVIALIFQLYPWSGTGVTLRPDFLLVVSLYWLLRMPNVVNIGVIWLAGLMVDLSTGSLIGQHALSYAITGFLALLFQRRIVLFNKWQLASYVLVLIFINRVIVLGLKLFADNENPGLVYFLPVLTSMLLWQMMRMSFGALTRSKR